MKTTVYCTECGDELEIDTDVRQSWQCDCGGDLIGRNDHDNRNKIN